jgi:pimeloyl-ACP methyl ester carboxylesterase
MTSEIKFSTGVIRFAIIVIGIFAFLKATDERIPVSDQPRLKRWLNSGHFFEFQDAKIFFRDSTDDKIESFISRKDKPILVLLHGFPSSSFDWLPIWQVLGRSFRLIAPDFIGFGFSDKPQAFEYSLIAQADLVASLLSHLQITSNIHILSHDYGVSIAQELLARQIESAESLKFRISSVVFLNGGLFSESHRPIMIQKVLASKLFGPIVKRFHQFIRLRFHYCPCHEFTLINVVSWIIQVDHISFVFSLAQSRVWLQHKAH